MYFTDDVSKWAEDNFDDNDEEGNNDRHDSTDVDED